MDYDVRLIVVGVVFINTIIISIFIIILVITFVQSIYSYTPKTNHVSRVYNVAAVLCLHLVPHVMLFCP
jgi:hypothetical protein